MLVNHKILLAFTIIILFGIAAYSYPRLIVVAIVATVSLVFITKDQQKLAVIIPIAVIILAIGAFFAGSSKEDTPSCERVEEQIKVEGKELQEIESQIKEEKESKSFLAIFDSDELIELKESREKIKDNIDKLKDARKVCEHNAKQ